MAQRGVLRRAELRGILHFYVAVFCMAIVEVVNRNVSEALTFVTDAISRREIARGRALWVSVEVVRRIVFGGR